MKKATQSIQALNSNIIRLSWLRYLLIPLRYMEVPEHSTPQTWMVQQNQCYLTIREYSQRFSEERGIHSFRIPELFISNTLAFPTNAEKH
jgi:hypothetical protein